MNAEFDWESIIYRGVESDELDYKAAQIKQLNRAGRAKFARHCWQWPIPKVVTVVSWRINPVNRHGLPDLPKNRAKSDPTTATYHRFADPQIDFTIERPEADKNAMQYS